MSVFYAVEAESIEIINEEAKIEYERSWKLVFLLFNFKNIIGYSDCKEILLLCDLLKKPIEENFSKPRNSNL